MICAQDSRVRVAGVGNKEKPIPVLDYEPADGRTSRAAGQNHRNSAVRIDAVVCRYRLVGRDAGGCAAHTIDVVGFSAKACGTCWGCGCHH
jgi:hypothetical protein